MMPDLSHLSDDQLSQIAQGSGAAPQSSAPDLSHLSDDQLAKIAGNSQNSNASWLDQPILGYTPRGAIQGTLSKLPMAGMIAGGFAGAETGPGAVATAALGGAAGKSLENAGEKYLLGKDISHYDALAGPALAGKDAAEMEMGGKLALQGAGAAAETGPGQYIMGKLGSAADTAMQVPKWAAQKVGRLFADVPEETTARYLENPSAVNSAPSREEISDKVLGLKQNAEDNLAKAKEELENASGDASAQKQNFREALKNHNLTSMVSDVHDSIGDLKNQVVQGSGKAYSILENSDGKVNTLPLANILQDHINDLYVNGVPKSPTAAQAINELSAYKQSLMDMGTKKIPGNAGTFTMSNHLTMPEAKQVLQGLDKTINWKSQVGSFAPETDQALSSLRTAVDQDVKTQVPEYRDQMSQVSRQARLLNAASDNFGTPEKAISTLNNISSQKGQAVHLPIVEALGQETGKDLSSPVNDFIDKQKILSTPSLFNKLIDETPEAKRVSSAQNALDVAKDKSKLFSGVTPDSITAKTKALNGANSYGAEAKFGPIDEAHGTDFQKQIQARNDLDQFSKDSTSGSRKAVMGTALGSGIGYGVAGKEGAVIGGTIGSQVGGTLDKYGGRIFQKGLDAGMSLGRGIGNVGEAAADAARSAPSMTGQGVMSVMPQAPTFPNAAQQRDRRAIPANQDRSQYASRVKGYSDGGMVTQNPPPPPPPTYLDPQRAQVAQDSLRKAFHFANGGTVPGTPQVAFNSPRNDTVLAKLTPGEAVLPLSVTQSPNAPEKAKEFMKNQMAAQKGPEKWATDGLQKLKQHVGDEDREMLEKSKGMMLLDPKAKNLLITASSFPPGSKPLDQIMTHLKNRLGKGK